jgi:hypothetical protein
VIERFGPLDPATRAAIEGIADSGRLQKLMQRAVTCTALDELVAGL